MNKSVPQNIMVTVFSYLMVGAVALRGIAAYPAVRSPIILFLGLFILLMLAESLVFQLGNWLSVVYVVIQITVMVILFVVEPDGDVWSILLLPSCIFVMRRYSPRIGWMWIGVFSIVMSVMLVYGHQEYAPQFIIIYLAAYLLVGSYALMLKQTEDARQESQALLRQLQEANQQLQDYVGHVEELTTIKERNRLARELHDSVTQTIFSMTLITRSTLILQERAPEQVSEKLNQLQELAHNALSEMRTLIYQLRPLSVAEDGLYAVLERHINDLNQQNDLSITLESDGQSLPLEASLQQELFRIIQEALNNIIKHAQAKNASVAFEATETEVCVAIRDDGNGFDPAQPNQDRSHIGLDSMRERAQELGGKLDIKSKPGEGTEVTVTIPIVSKGATHG